MKLGCTDTQVGLLTILYGATTRPLVGGVLLFAGSSCPACVSLPPLPSAPLQTWQPWFPSGAYTPLSGPGSGLPWSRHRSCATGLSPSPPWPRRGAVAPPQGGLGGWESPAQSPAQASPALLCLLNLVLIRAETGCYSIRAHLNVGKPSPGPALPRASPAGVCPPGQLRP